MGAFIGYGFMDTKVLSGSEAGGKICSFMGKNGMEGQK
jgi:hypothetical protein